MQRDDLRIKIYSKIDQLPTLPIVLLKLVKLLDDPKSSVDDVTETISHDAALAAKILKAANSAYYGFPHQITTLDRAVALLGFNMVKSLAVSIGVIQNLPSGKDSPRFTRRGLWLHSLAVGTAMKTLAESVGRNDDAEYLFLVGLLHDIGKVVLDQFFRQPFASALELAEANSEALFRAEERIIGIEHGEVGGILLTRWKLPETIHRPIASHHKFEIPDGTFAPDVSMLHVSDTLAQEVSLGEAGNPAPLPVTQEDLERLGLDTEDLQAIKKELERQRDAIYAFFSAIN